MSILDRILRTEVDRIDHGTEHLLTMQEREAERERNMIRLRSQNDQQPEGLLAAARRRLRQMT